MKEPKEYPSYTFLKSLHCQLKPQRSSSIKPLDLFRGATLKTIITRCWELSVSRDITKQSRETYYQTHSGKKQPNRVISPLRAQKSREAQQRRERNAYGGRPLTLHSPLLLVHSGALGLIEHPHRAFPHPREFLMTWRGCRPSMSPTMTPTPTYQSRTETSITYSRQAHGELHV